MKSKFTKHFLIFFFSLLLPLSLSSQSSASKECNEIIIQADVTPACQGMNNGELDLKISQGLPPYRIQWEDGSIRKTVKNLAKGPYSVSVTDALGCTSFSKFNVTSLVSLEANVQVQHNKKAGKRTGSIEIQMTGGLPPYSFSWVSNAIQMPSGFKDGLNSMPQLPAGWYRVVVFDAAGCYNEIDTEVK